jgi:hypothetical protein
LIIIFADDTQLASASVSIGNFVAGDILSFVNTANITGSYNSSTGVLTLTGTDTLANYQAALRSIKFNSTSDDPTANNTKPNRTISWQVTDANSDAAGAANSSVVTSTINITATNDAPVVTAGGSLVYTEQGIASIIDNSIVLNDADDTDLASATISIGNFVAGDILSFINTANITGFYNSSTGVLTLTGTDTLANYQAALRSIKFNSTSDDPTANNTKPNRTINWQVTDANSDGVGSENSTIVTSTINITTANNAPFVNAGAFLTYTEQDIATIIDGSIILNDVDDSDLVSATISIGNFVSGDILSFANTANITGSYNSSTGVLTLTGIDTLVNYQAALRSIKFNSTSFDPTVNNSKPDRIITFAVNDGQNTSSATSIVHINEINEAPIIMANGNLSYTEGTNPEIIDETIIIRDIDDTHLAGAVININNFVAGDILSFANTANITGSYNKAAGILTLTGMDTVENYQAALRAVKFNSLSSDPTLNNAKPTRTITWQIQDGNANGIATSMTNSTINITAIKPIANIIPASAHSTSLSTQVFFNGINSSFNKSAIEATNFNNSAKGVTNNAFSVIENKAYVSQQYNGATNWGWGHTPSFVNLVPIVQGLSSTLNALQIQESSLGASSLTNGASEITIKKPNIEEYNNTDSQTDEETAAQEQNNQNSEKLPIAQIRTNKNAADNSKHLLADKDQYQPIIKNKTFESRIKELLNDFGLGDIIDKT